jgi:isochorismate hydrolase
MFVYSYDEVIQHKTQVRALHTIYVSTWFQVVKVMYSHPAGHVICGCTTEGCVESTARDALFNDYYVVLAEDCVASDDALQHQASLFLMRHRFDVASSANILAVWQGPPQSAQAAGAGSGKSARGAAALE